MSEFYYQIASKRYPDLNGRTLNCTVNTNSGGLILDPNPALRFPTTAAPIRFRSDDASDNLGGAGLRRLLLFGLDENLVFQSEFILSHPTDGTNWSTSTLSYLRFGGAIVMEAGLVSNIGTIEIEQVGGPWMADIPPTEGRARPDTYTVPAGHMASISLVRYHIEKLDKADGSVHLQGRIRGVSWPDQAWNHTFTGWVDSERVPHVIAPQPVPYRYSAGTDLLMDFESTAKDLRVHLDLVVIEERDRWQWPTDHS